MEFKNWFRFRGCSVRLVTDEYVLTLADGKDSRTLHYDNDGYTAWVDGMVRYAEPLNEKPPDANSTPMISRTSEPALA